MVVAVGVDGDLQGGHGGVDCITPGLARAPSIFPVSGWNLMAHSPSNAHLGCMRNTDISRASRKLSPYLSCRSFTLKHLGHGHKSLLTTLAIYSSIEQMLNPPW